MNLKLPNHFAYFYNFLLLAYWSLGVTSDEDVFASSNGKQILRLAKTADIKSLMNLEADACHNFYNFACGAWHKINPAQYNGNINTDRLQTLAKGIKRKLNNLLERDKTGNVDDMENKLKDFFISCLNTRYINTQYRASLADLYKNFGEFSILKTAKQKMETKFKWWSTVAKIQNKYGKSIILSLYIFDDINDKSKTMAYIGPPDFEMTQGTTNMVDIVEENRISKYMQYNLNMSLEVASTMAKNIITFEKNLSWGTTDARRGKSIKELLTLYNTTDLFEDYYDLFDAKEYLEVALGSKDLPEQVYVYDKSYLEGLYDVFNTTSDEHVQDYILWLFIEEYMIDVNSGGFWKMCTDKSKKYFGPFIDHIIYNQYRSNESEAEVYDLWNDIKNTFKHNLESNKYYWISNETRIEAVRKLNNMKLTINSYDNHDFNKMFENLQIDPRNYVINVQNILENTEKVRGNKLAMKTEEDTQILSFTPVYNILENEIKIPIALLQPRFIWDPNYPKAIQYGTLGYLLAHEMLHGFDDEGRDYDSSGNANIWWDEKSAYEFESRRKCFEEQYHNYTYYGKRLPKSALQSENIADNGAVNIAYNAYVRWLGKRKLTENNVEASETLPRLEFNNRQLFFISFAQEWCEDIHSLFRGTFASADTHAPGMYRVIGTLSNSREFSWLFKCNYKKSNMDPPKKCEIY